MITDEDVENIEKGASHVVMTSQKLGLKCLKCGYQYDLSPHFPDGVPLWLMTGAAWGFVNEHADCEEEGSDDGV